MNQELQTLLDQVLSGYYGTRHRAELISRLEGMKPKEYLVPSFKISPLDTITIGQFKEIMEKPKKIVSESPANETKVEVSSQECPYECYKDFGDDKCHHAKLPEKPSSDWENYINGIIGTLRDNFDQYKLAEALEKDLKPFIRELLLAEKEKIIELVRSVKGWKTCINHQDFNSQCLICVKRKAINDTVEYITELIKKQ